MTVSAAEGFTIFSQGGSGRLWDGGPSSLLHGQIGSADTRTSYYDGQTNIVYLSVPNYAADILYGAQFDSLQVTFSIRSTQSGTEDYYARIGGGSWKSGTFDNAWEAVTLDGDATYWGLSEGAADIFTALKDGSIKFQVYATAEGGASIELKEVLSTLTYRDADTKRAAILTAIP